MADATDIEIAIVGTGFAGIGMAIKLLRAGRRSLVLLERASEVGGTWRDNIYPGCACDIPSQLYSFSFETDWPWSRAYPRQPEIQAYLEHCVAKYGLRPYIRCNAELTEARFERGRWQLILRDGRSFSARVLISAMGGLSKPRHPDIPGLAQFAGARFHSAEWDTRVDLAGKRVGVIGTGASAVQLVPQIAPKAAALQLFQRSPPWVLPKRDRALTPRDRLLLDRVPGYRWLLRQKLYWQHELTATAFTVQPALMAVVEWQARRFAARQLPDPELRRKVTPDYRLGCKRALIANDYYPALTRPNVEVVVDPIREVRPEGVVTADGTLRPLDVLVLATGFKATEFLLPVRIYGGDGTELSEAWRDGAEAYLGTVVAGFPNLFLLVGPNTGLGHNSVVFMIEAQLEYVMRCLAAMGQGTLEVSAAAQGRFNTQLAHRMRRTVWMTGCRSWYLDPRGRNSTLWPGFTFEYWWRTRRPILADFRTGPGGRA